MSSFRENAGTLPGKAARANGAYKDELYLKRAYENADQLGTSDNSKQIVMAIIIMMEHYINNVVSVWTYFWN